MRSLSRSDGIFLSIMTSLLCLSLAGFARETFFARVTARERQVGTITFKNRVAEQKTLDTTRWVNLVNSGPIYNRDTIRTGAGSTATIHLENSTEISLSENSMIYLDLSSKKPRLTLASGNLTIDTASADTPITLSTDSGEIDVLGGILDISADGKDTAVRVAKGSSSVQKTGTTTSVALDSTSAYSVSSGKSNTDAYILVEPASASRLFTADRARAVEFAWISNAGPDGDPTLVIAKDQSFSKPIISIPRVKSGRSVSLPEGSYYWKLDDSGRFGWFTVKRISVPRPVAPVNASFVRGMKSVSIPFAWSNTGDGAYHVIAYKIGAPEKPVIDAKVALSRASFEFAESGEYAWKVAGIAGNGEETGFENIRESRFSVRDGSLAAPDPRGGGKSRGNKIIVSALAGIEGKPIARWVPVTGAKAYDVRLSANPDGSDPRYEGTVKVAAVKPEAPLPPGTYYLSASTIGEGERSDFSEPVELEIRPIQPLSVERPPEGGKLTPRRGKIPLSWKDTNGGSRYRITCSASRDLLNPIATVDARKPGAEVSIPEDFTGDLFWKAELLDPKGNTVAETPILTAVVAREIPGPTPIKPIGGQKIDIRTVDEITLEWKKEGESAEYIVKLFRMTGGIPSPQGEWTTREASLSFKDLSRFALDGFAWEITAIERDAVSGESLASEPVTSYFRIIQKERLSVPKIKLMKSMGEL